MRAQKLVDLVRDGDRLLVGTGAGEPCGLLKELIEQVLPVRKNVEVVQVTLGGSEMLLTANGDRANLLRLPVSGPKGRKAIAEGRAEIVPMSMGEMGRAISSGEFPIDGLLFAGTISADGLRVNPGIALDIIFLAESRARFIAAELNKALPVIPSTRTVALANCQYVIETYLPPPSVADARPNETLMAIGRHVASIVPDGAIVEFGVGRALMAVPIGLAEAPTIKSISVHTGLMGDGVRTLIEAGKASRRISAERNVSVVGTAAKGTEDFYQWIDHNDKVLLVDSMEAQNSAYLAGLGKFVAINTAQSVDLIGQLGTYNQDDVFGGGGLIDFMIAGSLSCASVIAIESCDRHGNSMIVPQVQHVQIPGRLMTHLVTEFGVASLKGQTATERKRRIIEIAHPDHRDMLRDSVNNS